jgi:rubredoxin
MPKDPFRDAEKWINCPECGWALGYNPTELPLREQECLSCGYHFKSSDGRRKVCKGETEESRS